MSWLGVGRGIWKIVEGIAEADGEKIMKGIGGTALSSAGIVVSAVHDEDTGQAISEQGENMTEDV